MMIRDSFNNEVNDNDRLEHTNKLKDRVLHYIYKDNWLINEEEVFSAVKVDNGLTLHTDESSIWKVIR